MARPTNLQFAVVVHVLTYLAAMGPERPISSDELSASVNTNPVYVRRALGPLREAGLVRSVSGVHGGWQLCGQPNEITLADVWAVVHGGDPVLGLHGANPECPVGRDVSTALTGIDRQVAGAVRAELARTTVADLLAQVDVRG